MEPDELSPNIRKVLSDLRNASGSIQTGIDDALAVADNEQAFIETAIENLEELRSECGRWIDSLNRVVEQFSAPGEQEAV